MRLKDKMRTQYYSILLWALHRVMIITKDHKFICDHIVDLAKYKEGIKILKWTPAFYKRTYIKSLIKGREQFPDAKITGLGIRKIKITIQY